MANVISDETIEYVGILAKLELSPEEKDRYMKVGLMAEGMERHTLRKAIAAGETE